MSVAARIERGYYEELVRIIDADDHYSRLGDFVREAVLEGIDRWKKDHSPRGASLGKVDRRSTRDAIGGRPRDPTTLQPRRHRLFPARYLCDRNLLRAVED